MILRQGDNIVCYPLQFTCIKRWAVRGMERARVRTAEVLSRVQTSEELSQAILPVGTG